MGGKALNEFGITTERVDTQTLNNYYEYISDIIHEKLGIQTHSVICYREKKTHGDLDILLRIDSEYKTKNINLVNWINDTFKPNGINNNGGVISWEFNNFQIDFISVDEMYWTVYQHFMNFSPFGNLFGKIAHKFGLSFGMEGLFYKYRNFNGRLSQNIIVSTDVKKIFEFFEFDLERYNKGFNTEQEIFDYIIGNKYFDSKIFQMENLGRIDRKRNEKRPDYNRFITYINDNNIVKTFEFEQRVDYIFIINNFFPESKLIEKLNHLEIKDKQNQILSTKFNGKIVMQQYPNLKDKMLGAIITQFKNSIENWEEKFINMEVDEIMVEFDNYMCKNIKL